MLNSPPCADVYDILECVHPLLCDSSPNPRCTYFMLFRSTEEFEELTFYASIVQGIKSGDYVLVVRALSILLAIVPFFYVYCNVGEDVTEAFARIDHMIYMTNWCLCPLYVQNYAKFMIMIAQKPVEMEGFASMSCTRDTFRRVSARI